MGQIFQSISTQINTLDDLFQTLTINCLDDLFRTLTINCLESYLQIALEVISSKRRLIDCYQYCLQIQVSDVIYREFGFRALKSRSPFERSRSQENHYEKNALETLSSLM